jgi:hypothetical protein
VNPKIKDPTIRKVRNRGFTPICYHTDMGYQNGWIYKEGRKRLYIHLVSSGNHRVPKSERRYMVEL